MTSADWGAQAPELGMRALWRLAIWGMLATVALFIAVISAYSSAGSQRQAASVAAGAAAQPPADPAMARGRTSATEAGARAGESADETRRLVEAVRSLAADRDQALVRIAALERNVEDINSVTGSIKRDRPASPPPPAPSTPAPASVTAPAPAAAPAMAQVQAPVQEPPAATNIAPPAPSEPPTVQVAITAAPVPTPRPVLPMLQQSGQGEATPATQAEGDNRAAAVAPNPVHAGAEPPGATGLGIDVGGAINYEGLRTLWRSTKNNNPAEMEDLYPVVAVRENSRTHGIDLRLVVGPITDVEAASRVCLALSAAHRYCQPVAFEGQRLSLNEAASSKGATPHHAAAKTEAEIPTLHFAK